MAKAEKVESAPAEKPTPSEVLGGPSADRMLLKGPMPELSKMKLKELREECQMWRKRHRPSVC